MRKYLFLFILIFAYTNILPKSMDIVCVEDYPYSYVEDGVVKGIDVDVATLLLGTMQGYDISYIMLPRDEAFDAMYLGKYDAILPVSSKCDKLSYPVLPLSYRQYRYFVYEDTVLKDNPLIGTMVYTPFFDENNTYNILYFRNQVELIHAFSARDVDVIYVDSLTMHNYIDKLYLPVTFLQKYPHEGIKYKEILYNYVYIGFSDNVPKGVVDLFSYDMKAVRNTLPYKNIIAKYTTFRMYEYTMHVNRFYIPMLIIAIIAVFIMVLSYTTIALNHFNFKSLVFLLLGAVIASMGDLLTEYVSFIYYVKITGMLVLSYGVYKLMQKYMKHTWVVYLYGFTTLLGFSTSYFTNTVSLIYYTIALLSVYLLVYNIRDGFHNNTLINLATILYISFSLIIGLSMDGFITYSNIYSIIFGLAYMLQICDTSRRE